MYNYKKLRSTWHNAQIDVPQRKQYEEQKQNKEDTKEQFFIMFKGVCLVE